MRPPNQTDDGELERSPLDTRPRRQAPLEQLWAWSGARGRRWRAVVAICVIALAIFAPGLNGASGCHPGNCHLTLP